MIDKKNKNKKARARRVRNKIKYTNKRNLPRLSVYKSNTRIIAQIIDDTKAHTLVYVTSSDKDVKGENGTERAMSAGELLVKKAKEAGIEEVVFDRGASRYMGKIKAFADSARNAGLKF